MSMVCRVCWKKEIYDVMIPSHIPNLDVIPAGPIPTNPSELLGSAASSKSRSNCSKSMTLVIFDTPPVTAVADPSLSLQSLMV